MIGAVLAYRQEPTVNLPSQNIIDRPSLDSFELFIDAVASISDSERRVLAAVIACSTFEQVSKVTDVQILEIAPTVAKIANCRPRVELMEFEPRSKGYFFKSAHVAHAEAFADVQKFVAAFAKWAREPETAAAIVKAEGHRVSMFEARRVAA